MSETLESLAKEGNYTLVLIHPDGHRSTSRHEDMGQGSVEAMKILSESILNLERYRNE